jgi:hypothetical protein
MIAGAFVVRWLPILSPSSLITLACVTLAGKNKDQKEMNDMSSASDN